MNTFCWFYCTYATLVVVVLSGVRGQSIQFFEYNRTSGESGCTETLISNEDRIILKGQAYLPEESSIQKLIIFDLKTESEDKSLQLCTLNTDSDCHDMPATKDCYCATTDTANVYEFVVNITAESKLSYGRIKGYILFGNSSQIDALTMLPLVQDTKVGINADITINGKPTEEACNGTVQDEELKVTAQCQSPHTGCLLELSVENGPSPPIVYSGSLSYESKVQAPSNVTLRLRAASCSKEKFSLLQECSIAFTKDIPEHEAETQNNMIIIIASASSAGFLLLVSLIIIIIVCRRRSTRQRSQQSGEEELLKNNSIQGCNAATEDGGNNVDSHPLLVAVKNSNQDTCTINEVEIIPPPKPPRINSYKRSSDSESEPANPLDMKLITPTEKIENLDVESEIKECQENAETAQPEDVENHISQSEIMECQENTEKV